MDVAARSAVVLAALQPVLRDVRASGAPMPEIVPPGKNAGHFAHLNLDEPWATVMLRARGSAAGVVLDTTAPELDRILVATEQCQDWIVEDLWRSHRPPNWPACPRHPSTHPLKPARRGGAAMWTCPADDAVITAVGELSA